MIARRSHAGQAPKWAPANILVRRARQRTAHGFKMLTLRDLDAP